jgi:hypothetical protein
MQNKISHETDFSVCYSSVWIINKVQENEQKKKVQTPAEGAHYSISVLISVFVQLSVFNLLKPSGFFTYHQL